MFNRRLKIFDPEVWKALDLLCLLHPPVTVSGLSLQWATQHIYEGPVLHLKLERVFSWLLSQ